MTQENQIPFRCVIANTDPTVPLAMRVIVDGETVFDQAHITEPVNFEHWLPDAEKEHEIVFEMSGKTAEHTKINEAGEIVKDACLTLTDFSIDEVELTSLKTFAYQHDFNGTKEKTTESFYGTMGCNGQVSTKFSTPIYLWLLENL